MILYVSDFDLKASGYAQISIALCNELVNRHGLDVTALGISYDGSQHDWPFSIIPVNRAEYMHHVSAMIHNFGQLAEAGKWKKVEAIVVALDIPLQTKMLQIDRGSTPYIGIFPVESGPLCNTWATGLSLMTERLVISKFGLHMMEEAGLDGNYLPVGIDSESWRMPSPEERVAIRKSLGYEDNDFVVLTVADNQERKNLDIATRAIAKAREKINAKWVLVTRVDSQVGWKLDDLAASFDITEHFMKFNRGLPFDRLWFLYAAADAFLLTSKAEGLCMPILEAMATGTPVVASNCTALPEHLFEEPDWSRVKGGIWWKGKPKGERGFPIPIDYTCIDPWGNSVRSFPSADEAAKILVNLSKMSAEKQNRYKSMGRQYAEGRTWIQAGIVANRAIQSAIDKVAAGRVIPDQSIVGLPASIPRPIPVVETEEGSTEDE
jgi:glycosyltransferase involved in cell wall biosynthesis